jgi:hypothetical protein
LPKNQPAPSSPPRSPPSRLRHTVLRASIYPRTAPPFCRGAHPRMSQVTCPWRLLGVRCRDTLKPIRPASGQSHSDSQITCVHALASRRRGNSHSEAAPDFPAASGGEPVSGRCCISDSPQQGSESPVSERCTTSRGGRGTRTAGRTNA